MIRGGLVTLCVRDMDRAVRFYVETLGMKLVEEAGTAWAVIDAGEGFRIGLARIAPGAAVEGRGGFTPSVRLLTKVPILEAISIFENRGLHFEVKEEGPSTFAHFRDPDDNLLCLVQER